MEVDTIQLLHPRLLLRMVDPAAVAEVQQVLLVDLEILLQRLLLREMVVVEDIMAIHIQVAAVVVPVVLDNLIVYQLRIPSMEAMVVLDLRYGTEPPATPSPTRTIGDGGYFAGGGAGGSYPAPDDAGTGGSGGGGDGGNSGGGNPRPAGTGDTSTGGGGGGGGSVGTGANGGSGIVVVRYQIGQLAASAKATGGAISFYNNKTIHTFTTSGDFNVTSSISGAEFVLVGGGGAGGGGTSPESYASGGGGGAGGMVVHTGPVSFSTGPHTVTVGGGVSLHLLRM